MSGLRTRKYVTLVAMLFASWSIIHITVNLRRQDAHSRYDDDLSHSSDRHSPSSLVPNHGYRKPSSDDRSSPLPAVSPKGLDDIHRLKIHTPQANDKDPDLPPPDAQILPPTTNLALDTKYLSYMAYAGLTNQFMALENAAYIATRLNRTLIIPPIITNSHDRHNSNQRWSEFFDLDRFTASTGIKVVEWTDVRPLTDQQSAVGKHQARLGAKNYPLWQSLAQNLTCQVIYGFGDSERLHTTENTFARQFLFKPVFVRPPHRDPKTPVYDRIAIGAKDNTNMEDVVTFDDLMMACITPLGHYAEAVEKARDALGERLPVIVTTDSQDSQDHVTMARMGWKRLNHDAYTTEQELGIFGAAMVDASILAHAEVMIGTYVSSMSRVAAWRQKSWYKRTVLYPRTTPSWTPALEK
ncbi:hypothetical protein BGZ92_001457 [Podila epicladia]|nr:hypothetical protein BGZ92_001457 [Podila epicladia]